LLAPETIAQSGPPGATLTTTLHLTNTGDLTDTFSLDLSGNVWAVHLSITQTILAAGEGTTVAVGATIPADTADGMADSVTITTVSQGDPLVSASSTLTTTAVWWKNYLPVIKR